MVNLVVRHASHLQSTLPRSKLPAATTRHSPSPKPRDPRDRNIPSPIRIPNHRADNRPLSPLTAAESMFGTVQVARSHSSHASARRMGLDTAGSRDSSGELECDYDKNVIPLYELLESSQWDKARIRCRTYPEEVQTWIVRRDANAHVRWKLLPLHAAVIFQAPASVIEGMLKEFPVAAGKRDDQGMLPLHLAFRHKQEESLMELLLDQYPQGVAVKDIRDRLPIDHGKDTQFSWKLMQVYAEAHSKCQPAKESEDCKGSYDAQLGIMKSAYEERLNALVLEREQAIGDLKLKMEQDQHVIRTQHDQEMDELRDLLSREVATGQRSQQLESEVQDLQNSLGRANQETQVLRTVVHDQKVYQEELKDHMRDVLKDQLSMHVISTQQQEELEQAQKLRDQLLRSLMQKQDGNAIQASKEICQLSDDIQLRTEQILSRNATTPQVESLISPVLPIDTSDNRLNHVAKHRIPDYQEQKAEWVEPDDHDDDISAMTEDHF
jgi:hypothetical protein